jgi:hypothetical protein
VLDVVDRRRQRALEAEDDAGRHLVRGDSVVPDRRNDRDVDVGKDLWVVMRSVVHDTTRYANNRAEVSHQPTPRREHHMRGFKSAAQAPSAFLPSTRSYATCSPWDDISGVPPSKRLLRSRAFGTLDAVTAA